MKICLSLLMLVVFQSSCLRAQTSHGSRPTNALRPNIVFFLIDDLGYADCGFNGGTDIRTPRIDQLAGSGAILESHYVQPVCSPTRAALMTGRYATHTGVYTVVRPHARWGLPLAERTLASALRETGYETAIVGKWHLGEFDPAYYPMARGFDHQHGLYFGMIDNYTHIREGSHDWHHDDQELREDGYSTHLLTREACRLIDTRDKSKPLFLYVPYNAVHAPLQVPEQYLSDYSQLNGARRQLAGMLAAVDEGIGQIVDTLERNGLRENTLIVFSADNGGPPPGSNTPLKGFKGSLWEGGIRGCAFATWPGKIPGGQRLSEPMHIIDWYPTLIALAGGSTEQTLPVDGLDVWGMLTQQQPSPHDEILNCQSPTKAALRMGDWKLMLDASPAAVNVPAGEQSAKKNKKKNAQRNRLPTESLALYHLKDDPAETTNLAEKEPDRVQEMRTRLDALLANAVPPGQSVDATE